MPIAHQSPLYPHCGIIDHICGDTISPPELNDLADSVNYLLENGVPVIPGIDSLAMPGGGYCPLFHELPDGHRDFALSLKFALEPVGMAHPATFSWPHYPCSLSVKWLKPGDPTFMQQVVTYYQSIADHNAVTGQSIVADATHIEVGGGTPTDMKVHYRTILGTFNPGMFSGNTGTVFMAQLVITISFPGLLVTPAFLGVFPDPETGESFTRGGVLGCCLNVGLLPS